MSRGLFLVGLVAGSLLLLGSEKPDTSRWPIGDEVKWTAPLTPADTIRSTVPAGTPLVQSLPSVWNGATVTTYAVLEGPALCGVAGRSFTWITASTSPGTYNVRLQASHPTVAPDTLVMQIEVEG